MSSLIHTARMSLVAINGAEESLLGSLSRALPAILTSAVSRHLPPYFATIDSESAAKALLDEMLSQSEVTAILTQSGEPAGLIFLHIAKQASARGGAEAHLGYLLAERYWGGGIASECLSAYLDHLKARQPELEIVAGVEQDNAASVRLLQKLGFVHSGQDRDGVSTYRL